MLNMTDEDYQQNHQDQSILNEDRKNIFE